MARFRIPDLLYVPGLAIIGSSIYRFLVQPRSVGSVITLVFSGFIGFWFLIVANTVGRIIPMYRNLWSGPHTYRHATEKDLVKLDSEFYEQSTAALEPEGFGFIGDVVNVTTETGWPKNHTVLRLFIGDQGTTMCTLYHVRLYGFVGLLAGLNGTKSKLKIVECETELSDGTYITTANNAETERTGGYPFQDRRQLPSATPPGVVVHEHRAHVQAVLAQKQPPVGLIHILDGAQFRQSQDRLHLKKCAYRKSANFSYKAEWESVAGRQLDSGQLRIVDKVAKELSDGGESHRGPN